MKATLAVLLALAAGLAAQTAPPASNSGAAERCLVMPFANRSGDPNLDWIGESFVIAFRQALGGSPVTVLSRPDRERARALLGAAPGVALSHASMMRLAQDADARWLVMGWYDYDGEQFSSGAEVLDLRREHLVTLPAVSGALARLQSLQARLGWGVRQRLDPDAAAATEPAPGPALPVSAYEDFVRARLAAKPDDQVKLLRMASIQAPADGRVLLALGEAYFAAHMDAPAAATLETIAVSAPQYPEAAFTAGLAEFGLGHYARAVTQWQAVEQQLPLPEVTHNLAVAKAAQAGAPHPGSLDLTFPAEEYEQLRQVVARFQAAKVAGMTPARQADYELALGQRLQRAGALAAAEQAFSQAVALAGTNQKRQLAAAHAGLAAIWYARHDTVRAGQEAAAALAADPENAQAQTIQRELGNHPHP